ncbi:hypothetical protein B0H16DRAFT_1476412 [Mycena metata]|uniref:Uncharacterized protein n=1 Tax=Mycena metata TaxID=1033252 RepID=A0AAD7HBU9_9AGAR|nr:hypothetical protein B0H16DRAFT_1476412 [Mycena metata]
MLTLNFLRNSRNGEAKTIPTAKNVETWGPNCIRTGNDRRYGGVKTALNLALEFDTALLTIAGTSTKKELGGVVPWTGSGKVTKREEPQIVLEGGSSARRGGDGATLKFSRNSISFREGATRGRLYEVGEWESGVGKSGEGNAVKMFTRSIRRSTSSERQGEKEARRCTGSRAKGTGGTGRNGGGRAAGRRLRPPMGRKDGYRGGSETASGGNGQDSQPEGGLSPSLTSAHDGGGRGGGRWEAGGGRRENTDRQVVG